MNILCSLCLAVLTVWDYPARQPQHESLRAQFAEASQKGDLAGRVTACRKATELLPEDPTWRYNLACALASAGSRTQALEQLENAIDLGFRDEKVIAADVDFMTIAGSAKFKELLDYARTQKGRPLFTGPLAVVPATGRMGEGLALGAHNLTWDLDTGCFDAKLQLTPSHRKYDGFLYMNRDGRHSMLAVTNYPGMTPVRLDVEGTQRGFALDFPNMSFPLPVFGNCSRGLVAGANWRSLPRALMTGEARRMMMMSKFYLSNQVWVFPAVNDYNFTSTNYYGDVFASVTPYWVTTQGISWSDLPYLKALIEAAGAMKPETRQAVVKRGLLAPTLQRLLRRNLKSVETEADYLTAKAHPTAFPPGGVDVARLKQAAAALKPHEIPPVAIIKGVKMGQVFELPTNPELTYLSPCAWAFVLRSPDTVRTFTIQAEGGTELAFELVHDEKGAAKLKRLAPNTVEVMIDREKMSVTNRVDVGIFAKTPASAWGAPSFVSFAVVDPTARYSDPLLTPQPKTDATKPQP